MEDKSTEAIIAELKQQIGDKAKSIICEKMLEKIISLQKIHESLPSPNISIPEQDNVSSKSNQELLDCISILKSELIELLDMLKYLIIHIKLEAPGASEETPFKVSVQDEILEELKVATFNGEMMLCFFTELLKDRANVIRKSLKYPQIEDYTLGAKLDDAMRFHEFRRWLRDMEAVNALLYNLLTNLSLIHI
eukprot:TRINITY_DN9121_c0_g1_i1.p1 TRINITY_DN9121_c0_g1~~TRINITY_DN9121_c0_g1_i1.p1  ORF type:complete len:210 (-),score=27.48 TRINITY_DN9121_c0_g1_i1:22-600(-)